MARSKKDEEKIAAQRIQSMVDAATASPDVLNREAVLW